MKTSPFLVLACVLFAAVSFGQTPRRGAGVDPTEAIPAFNPVEFKDGVVTFHMYAPQATKVEVRGEAITVAGKEFLPMAKDDRGVWSASLSGLRPDGYTYLYMVDGAPTVDQKNTGAKVGPRGNNNRFLMPGYPDFYADKPVPHGKVEINFYPSDLLKETRRLWIYTPPGYSTGNQKYPVLYLLHGSGDLEGGWVEEGRANFVLDNLIAAAKAKPMIIVMPRGHVAADSQIDREKNNDVLQQVLYKEIVPYVDSHYRTLTDRGNRAIMGLSMGGGQSLRFGLQNTGLFATVIGLSPAIRYPEDTYKKMFADLIASPEKTNQQMKMLMIFCGTKDHLLDASDAFDKFLTASKIKHEYRRTEYEPLWPGRRDDHTWPIWRMNLRDAAPLLFR
jgi:enterochelin esterase family protein